MENNLVTPEEFMSTLEELAKTIKEKVKSQTPQDAENLENNVFKISLAFRNGGLASFFVDAKEVYTIFKSVKDKLDYTGYDTDKMPFFIRGEDVLNILVEKEEDD